MVEKVSCDNFECTHNVESECVAEEIVTIKEGICIADSQEEEMPKITHSNIGVDKRLCGENLLKAADRMTRFKESLTPMDIRPQIKVAFPIIRHTDIKWWVPYGSELVLVFEEVVYRYVYRIQGYLRDKRQVTDYPRCIKV